MEGAHHAGTEELAMNEWQPAETMPHWVIEMRKRSEDAPVLGFKLTSGIYRADEDEPSTGWTEWRELGVRGVVKWAKDMMPESAAE